MNTQMLLMVMFFSWAEQQEASWNIQKQNKGNTTQKKLK